MILLIIFVFITITVYYFKRKNKYWYNKGVETPEPTIIFGNMYDIVINKTGRGKHYHKLYRIYKSKGLKYFGFYTFVTPVLIVINTDLIKSILQTNFQYFRDRHHYVNEKNETIIANLFRLKGSQWQKVRTMLTPTFTLGKMKMMFPTLLDCSKGLINVANQSVEDKGLININNVALRYTTDVIVSCAFGVDCNSLENPNSEFIRYGKMILNSEKNGAFKEFFSQSFPKLTDFLKLQLVPNKVKSFLTDFVTQNIKNRETHNIQRRDFIDLLIKLKNNETISEEDGTSRNTSFTIDQIVAQVYIFFLAGYETSATTLSFCFYELSLNEKIQDKLRNEIQSILKEYGGQITYEGLSKMTYMDMVIKETLRKYPPVLSLNRKCVKSYKVPDSNLVIEKDTNILIPVFSIHRDEEYYPNPTVFDPERFNSTTPSCVWLAFGEGPRNCIGSRFALIEIKIALTALISKYKFTNESKNSMHLTSVGPFLASQEDIILHVEKY